MKYIFNVTYKKESDSFLNQQNPDQYKSICSTLTEFVTITQTTFDLAVADLQTLFETELKILLNFKLDRMEP